MRRMFLKSILTLGALGLTGSLATLPALGQDKKPVAVTVPIGDWIGYTPWYVAKEKGFDVANGVTLIPVKIATSGDVTAALANGQISSAHVLITTAIQRQSAGVDFKIVLFQGMSITGDALIAGGNISSLKELAGKRVALVRDSGREYLLRMALKRAGMGVNDINIVDVNSDELAGLAFVTGKVDAAVSYEPYISNALAQNPSAKLLATAGNFPGLISDSWIVSSKFLNEHPDAVVGMIRAWDQAVKYMKANKDESFQIIVKRSGMKLEDLKQTYAAIKLVEIEEGLQFLEKEMLPMANNVKSMMKEFGSLKGDHDFASLIELGPIKRALAK